MKHLLFFLFVFLPIAAGAQQITGYVTDAETGDSIPYASVVYKGHQLSAISNGEGRYVIARHEGWNITFSAVGYKTRIIPVNAKTKAKLNIALKPDRQTLAEVKGWWKPRRRLT